jgi:hypothetical protein
VPVLARNQRAWMHDIVDLLEVQELRLIIQVVYQPAAGDPILGLGYGRQRGAYFKWLSKSGARAPERRTTPTVGLSKACLIIGKGPGVL